MFFKDLISGFVSFTQVLQDLQQKICISKNIHMQRLQQSIENSELFRNFNDLHWTSDDDHCQYMYGQQHTHKTFYFSILHLYFIYRSAFAATAQ